MTELLMVLLCLGTSYSCVGASFFLIVRTNYYGPEHVQQMKYDTFGLVVLSIIWPFTLFKLIDRGQECK